VRNAASHSLRIARNGTSDGDHGALCGIRGEHCCSGHQCMYVNTSRSTGPRDNNVPGPSERATLLITHIWPQYECSWPLRDAAYSLSIPAAHRHRSLRSSSAFFSSPQIFLAGAPRFPEHKSHTLARAGRRGDLWPRFREKGSYPQVNW